MKFFDQWNRPPDSFEENSGEVIVERTGYVPANVLIENMIYAGERLEVARSDYYDFPSEEEVIDDFVDVTRTPGFDIADAHQIARSANSRIAEQRKLFEKEKAERETLLKKEQEAAAKNEAAAEKEEEHGAS